MPPTGPRKSPIPDDSASTDAVTSGPEVASSTAAAAMPPPSDVNHPGGGVPSEQAVSNGTTHPMPKTETVSSNGVHVAADATTSTTPSLASLQILDAKASLREDGVEKVDSVEWGPGKHEDGYDSDQTLAPKPKNERLGEPCGCQTPDIVLKLGSDAAASTSLEELIKEHICCRDDSCINYAMREECRSNCEASDFCGNKRLQNKDFIPTAVIDAGPKGRGLAVLTDCKKGDFLAEYVGQAICNKALPKLFRRYQHERRLYIMALDDKTYIDARLKGGVARFINHSCSPNAKVERWKVKGVLRAVVVAIKDIPRGAEVTFDYQWQRQRGRALTKCYCLEPNCRGTLESQALSKEEQDENIQKRQEGAEEAIAQLPEGSWHKGLSIWTESLPEKDTLQKPDQTVVNKAIRVYSKEHQEYFVGEVTDYDPEKNLHQVLYQEDFVEVWEDLRTSDWMVLAEENPQSALSISRKAKRMNVRSSLYTQEPEAPKPLLISGSSKPLKNYIYVTTPVKEAMWARHLVERCERTCSVQIRPTSFNRSNVSVANPDDSEHAERMSSLEQSQDGMVWKITITGGDIFRAQNILTKNVAYVKRMLDESATARGSEAETIQDTPTEQIIYPRLIADPVKRKFTILREKCRNVTLSFAPSESISKQFARLVIEGNAGSDLESAKSFIWSTLLNVCTEMKAPTSTHGIPDKLGFLGGELTKDQLVLLGVVQSDPTSQVPMAEGDDAEPEYHSSFFKSFGNTHKCTVWIQSEEDMGRISSQYRVVGDAMSTNLRKVYIGCDPKDIPKIWDQIKERVKNLERGMRFIHLGGDRIYQQLLLQNGAEFFRYVYSITGASVSFDSLTGDHLMIDGSKPFEAPAALPPEVIPLDAKGKAELAAEIVRLQIEIFRDHYTKKQSWIFGRDWSLTSRASPTQDTSTSLRSVFGKLDERSAPQCCMEIAGVVANMELEKSAGAHAAVILYRYLNVENFPSMKAREATLACAYIANKAQKAQKWRKIDSVVKAGYATFYPETEFEPNTEEVLVLEERVVAAEADILEKLEYDVFFRDTKSVVEVMDAVLQGDEKVKQSCTLAFSGQVLGAGAELWLKFGIEYILVACAALLEADFGSLIPALSLIPLKVQTAAEIIVDNVKFGPPAAVPFLEKSRNNAKRSLGPIRTRCMQIMQQTASAGTVGRLPESARAAQRYRDIARDNQQQFIIQSVPSSECREKILPNLENIITESCCTIFIDPGAHPETSDIILIGSWRAVGLAEHGLAKFVPTMPSAAPVVQGQQGPIAYNSKGQPGFLSTAGIQTNEDWASTNHSMAWTHGKGIRIGGKICVAARVSREVLSSCGLRWWIPKSAVTSRIGTISSSLLGLSPYETNSKRLASFASAAIGDLTSYPNLMTLFSDTKKPIEDQKSSVAVSLQRWPPEKVSRNEKKRTSKSKRRIDLGFSPAALQEMQLLTRLHTLIDLPRGHPNLVLPVGIALPVSVDTKKESQEKEEDPMFSLFKSVEENESAIQKDKKVKQSPQIVFDPCPFVMPRFLSRSQGVDDLLKFPVVVSAWFCDLLSAMAHCHSNMVILRSLLPDQIVIDCSGVAKLGGLYRCGVYKKSRRTALQLARKGTQGRKDDDNEDASVTPTTAPELLLGCPTASFESDIWMIGCTLAHLLLGKPLFSGKERSSLLTSQYKVVGVPSSSNFKDATKFPLYEEPAKRYKRGVEKAFEHMMNAETVGQYREHIDLIARMLHLNPDERCTIEEALQHPCVAGMTGTVPGRLRYEYAVQWNQLQDTLLRSQEERSESKGYQKRKAMLISAVGDDAGGGEKESDDLYDLDDLLEPTKKPRTG
eukprot:scaffold2103_cov185-Amphora_coffeaeformis.AAC.38